MADDPERDDPEPGADSGREAAERLAEDAKQDAPTEDDDAA